MKETDITLYDTVVVYPIIFLPVLIMFYIVSSSFLNQNSSTLVYGIGFIITLIFTGIVNRLSLNSATKSGKERQNNPSEYCFYGIPTVATSMIGYFKASPNASILMYTFMYFISATIVKHFSLIVNPIMMLDKLFEEDLYILIFFVCLLYLTKKVEKRLQCNNEDMNGVDYVNGMVVGFFAFWSYVTLFFVMGKESFFIQSHFLSNKKYCTSPGNVTYRCDNTPIPKKYIIVSGDNYITDSTRAIQPHNDHYYGEGDTVSVTNKVVYLSPGTKIKYSENSESKEKSYEDLKQTTTEISMVRAYKTYSGNTKDVKHYVDVRLLTFPQNTTIDITSIA